MGNSESEVNDSLKAQAGGAGGPELYKLISVGSAGGELFKLMKAASQNKDYTEVDAMIKSEIPKYLYNDGAGENLPVKEFVLKRAGGKPLPPQLGSNAPTSDKPTSKFHCWKLEKSGAVGESLLHVCFLNGTKLHIELAKRLLKYFPKLINDIYLSEDYYGESVLHMAVVSEDPALVKILLSCGADVHVRATGKFFTPDDQKSGRVNTPEQEEALLPLETNYVGLSYFGEYPLSFAAILNQPECIRLLIAYKADPNKQDTNGNTVMHMMVIKNNLKMFEFMLQFDVRLDIKNRQGLTPLSLAAKLARKEMFDFILEHLRKVEWHYANISCAAYPLDTIDTIGLDGRIDIKSSIYSICYGESVEHLDLLEGYITNLINVKWETYIKQKFYVEVAIYLVYFLLCGIVLILKRVYFDYLETIGCVIVDASYRKLLPECGCAYMNPNDPNANIRFFLELVSWIYTVGYVFLMSNELYVQGYRLYAQTLLLNPFKIFFIMSLVCTLLIIPMRYSCNVYAEDVLMVLAIIMKSLYILYLGRGFTRICTFVYIIHQVLKTQFFRFICIWAIFAFGFSQAFYMSYNYGASPVKEVFQSPLISLLNVLVMLVNDLLYVYDNMIISKYSVVGRILLFAYMILGGIMMINLLIAMMSDTYDQTQELEREPLRQWARQVLIIEQNIGIKERLKQQKKYAYVLMSGEKTFMVRWKQTPEERKELKHRMKVFLRLQTQRMEEELKSITI